MGTDGAQQSKAHGHGGLPSEQGERHPASGRTRRQRSRAPRLSAPCEGRHRLPGSASGTPGEASSRALKSSVQTARWGDLGSLSSGSVPAVPPAMCRGGPVGTGLGTSTECSRPAHPRSPTQASRAVHQLLQTGGPACCPAGRGDGEPSPHTSAPRLGGRPVLSPQEALLSAPLQPHLRMGGQKTPSQVDQCPCCSMWDWGGHHLGAS